MVKGLLSEDSPTIRKRLKFNIAGTASDGRAQILEHIYSSFGNGNDVRGIPVELVPEPENEFDPNAVAVMWQGLKLGYVPVRQCTSCLKSLSSNMAEGTDGQCPHCGHLFQEEEESWLSRRVSKLLRGAEIEAALSWITVRKDQSPGAGVEIQLE